MQGSGSYTLELPNHLYSPSLQLPVGFLVQGNTLRLDGAGFETTKFDLIEQRGRHQNASALLSAMKLATVERKASSALGVKSDIHAKGKSGNQITPRSSTVYW